MGIPSGGELRSLRQSFRVVLPSEFSEQTSTGALVEGPQYLEYIIGIGLGLGFTV